MILTDEDIIEYQDLVRKRHGIEISKEEALKDASCLIQFVKICVEAKVKYGDK